jgi:hypothetical protein
MRVLLRKLIAQLDSTTRAESTEEIEAVQHLRYRVYVEEKGWDVTENVDHERRLLSSPGDTAPETDIVYTGTPDAVRGAIRLTTWAPGDLPESVAQVYGLGRFRGVEDHVVTRVTAGMMVPELRGHPTALTALIAGALRMVVKARQPTLWVTCCPPGLLASYLKVGLRPTGGPLVQHRTGVLIPMVGSSTDLAHLWRVRSPLLPVLAALNAAGTFPQVAPVLPLDMESGESNVLTDPARVLEALRVSPGCTRLDGGILAWLPPCLVEQIAAESSVLDVPAGTVLARAGVEQREAFMVLSGLLEESRHGLPPVPVWGGDVFGTDGALSLDGRRVTTVRAVTPSRVLILRSSRLQQALVEVPELAQAQGNRILTQQA